MRGVPGSGDWVGAPWLQQHSESPPFWDTLNVWTPSPIVQLIQWYHAFGQDLTTWGACDSDREASRRRRRKAGMEGKGAKLPVLFTTSTHSTQTELCCVQCAPPGRLPAALLPGSRQTCDLESAQAKLHCKLKNTKYRALTRHLTRGFNLPRNALTISYLWKTFCIALTKRSYISNWKLLYVKVMNQSFIDWCLKRNCFLVEFSFPIALGQYIFKLV